jgi:hypothetical protein
MGKYIVTLTQKVEIDLEGDDGVPDEAFDPSAIAVAKCFLDFEEEDAEDKRDNVPMTVYTSSRGKVKSYDHEFVVEHKT